MAYYITKILITSLLVVLISELTKRSTYFGALLASIPFVSVMAMVWLYVDIKDVEKISQLATNIFWLVIPSLGFFVALPLLLGRGLNFYTSLVISTIVTALLYWMMTIILRHFSINL